MTQTEQVTHGSFRLFLIRYVAQYNKVYVGAGGSVTNVRLEFPIDSLRPALESLSNVTGGRCRPTINRTSVFPKARTEPTA